MKSFIECTIGGYAETMELSLVDGGRLIAILDSDMELLQFDLRPNIGLHVNDDPIKFFEKKYLSLNINSRCSVSIKDTEHLGTVRYKGKFHRKNGIFIGVELDDLTGDTNGV